MAFPKVGIRYALVIKTNLPLLSKDGSIGTRLYKIYEKGSFHFFQMDLVNSSNARKTKHHSNRKWHQPTGVWTFINNSSEDTTSSSIWTNEATWTVPFVQKDPRPFPARHIGFQLYNPGQIQGRYPTQTLHRYPGQGQGRGGGRFLAKSFGTTSWRGAAEIIYILLQKIGI